MAAGLPWWLENNRLDSLGKFLSARIPAGGPGGKWTQGYIDSSREHQEQDPLTKSKHEKVCFMTMTCCPPKKFILIVKSPKLYTRWSK